MAICQTRGPGPRPGEPRRHRLGAEHLQGRCPSCTWRPHMPTQRAPPPSSVSVRQAPVDEPLAGPEGLVAWSPPLQHSSAELTISAHGELCTVGPRVCTYWSVFLSCLSPALFVTRLRFSCSSLKSPILRGKSWEEQTALLRKPGVLGRRSTHDPQNQLLPPQILLRNFRGK